MSFKYFKSKKPAPRGAQPIAPKKTSKPIPWGALPWRTLSVTISLCSILYALHLWKNQWQIDDVVIRGELSVLSAQDIAQELLWLKHENFFDVDLDEVKQIVINLPLIADARIKKVWPASVEIQLLEAKPLAIWNKSKLLGSDGQLSDLPNKPLPTLSRISGAEQHAYYAVEVYSKIQTQLHQHHLAIETLNVSTLGAFDVQLIQGATIKLGRKQLNQRLNRLEKLLQQLDVSSIESIDLRYGRGAAVLFNTQEQNKENKG